MGVIKNRRWPTGAGAGSGKLGAVAAAVLAASLGAGAGAQTTGPAELPASPGAMARPLVLTSGVTVEPGSAGAVALTLDEAIATGLKNNTEIKVRQQQERFVAGQRHTALQQLLPNLTAVGYTRAQEINLAAMGFKPGSVKIQGFNGKIPQIVKVNTTDAQLNLTQQLFNAPTFVLYRATALAVETTNWATLNARGGVVVQVGGLYLKVLADAAMVRNAEALVKQDEVVFDHAKASRDAGVGINLDVLRAQVELQNERQKLIGAENTKAKDTVLLNRAMGQPAGQALELVDGVPYADFVADSSDAAVQTALVAAFERRKDLRELEVQLEIAEAVVKALKYERLPTLAMGGFYGVLGQTTGSYHGVFAAQGRLSIPVFGEATIRGQKEIAQAQMRGVQQQIAARRTSIEADIRTSLLDVQSSAELVKVARSNVELSQQALADATDRFTAGVADSLPVVRAQAALEGAETRVVQAEFNYNFAKLGLARNSGVVETQYDRYLGK